MVKPDDDFDDDFDDDDVSYSGDNEIEAGATKSDPKQHDTRRRIEDILEKRRLKEEFGDYLDF